MAGRETPRIQAGKTQGAARRFDAGAIEQILFSFEERRRPRAGFRQSRAFLVEVPVPAGDRSTHVPIPGVQLGGQPPLFATGEIFRQEIGLRHRDDVYGGYTELPEETVALDLVSRVLDGERLENMRASASVNSVETMAGTDGDRFHAPDLTGGNTQSAEGNADLLLVSLPVHHSARQRTLSYSGRLGAAHIVNPPLCSDTLCGHKIVL